MLAFIKPQIEQLAGTGMFAPSVAVGDDAEPKSRLLALLGRRA
ncbi:MAG: hypothetical protein ACRDQ4_13640 [Pseudonocardiaceae bacterium]